MKEEMPQQSEENNEMEKFTREAVKLREAKEIFDEDLLGPEEIEKTWGFRPDEIPEVPFPREELERAKEMRQMLILRVDRTKDGKPMSLEAMIDIIQKRWDKEGKGKLLYTDNEYKNWKERTGDDFGKKAPRTGWALVSKDLIRNSVGKNYIEQTEVIINAMREKAFKDLEMPEEYEEAIQEFEANKARLTELMSKNWQQAAKELSELKISQLARQSVQETIYDLAMYYDVNGKRLLPSGYTWSNTCAIDNSGLVRLGFNAGDVDYGYGVVAVELQPDYKGAWLGVSLSRRL